MRLIDKQDIAIERWNVDTRPNSNPHESDFGHNLGITPRDPALQNVYYVNVWTELTLANMVTTQNVVDIRTHSSFRIEVLHGEQITDEFFFSLLNLAQIDFNNLIQYRLQGTPWNALHGEDINFDEYQAQIAQVIDIWERTLRQTSMN